METRNEGGYYRAIPVFEPGRDAPNLADDIKTLFRAFSSRWKLIALSTMLCLCVGLAYLWLATPGYKATAEILLDPRERKLVDTDIVATGMGSSSQGADTTLVESQVEILKSRSLLTELIQQLDLEHDPDFGGGAGQKQGASLGATLKSLLYGPNSGSYTGLSPFDSAMASLVDAIKIERVGNTYVLRATVSSGSPDKAAAIANALAELYLKDSQGAVDDTTRQAAAALEARLDLLRKDSETAQQAVEDYRTAHGLIGADGVLVDEQQLSGLNDQVTQAAIATQAAKAKYEEMQRQMGLPLSTISGLSIFSSELVDSLRTQLDAARGEEQGLAGVYGERHPQLILARQKREALEKGLEDELARLVSRAESEFKTAQQTEASLRDLLAAAEARRAQSNSASIQLRELQRKADDAQQLYQNFSNRAAQIREQVDLPATTARIISKALPPSQPSEPRLVLVLALAGVAGAGLGAAVAWLLHLLNGTPASTPRRQRRPEPVPTVAPLVAVNPKSVRSARDEIVAAHRRPSESRTQSNPKRRLMAGLFR